MEKQLKQILATNDIYTTSSIPKMFISRVVIRNNGALYIMKIAKLKQH